MGFTGRLDRVASHPEIGPGPTKSKLAEWICSKNMAKIR